MPSQATFLRRTLDRLRGRPIEHDLEPYRVVLAKVNALEPEVAPLSDAGLRERAFLLLFQGLGQLWKGRRDRRARAEATSRTSRPR